MLWHNSFLVFGAVSAAVSVAVTGLLIGVSRARQRLRRRRKLESVDNLDAVTTATAAVEAAAVSLKKMIEAVPGTSSAFTGRSATTAIDATTRAVLAILTDIPIRMQTAEQSIHRHTADLREMRELFNRLGNK